MINRRTVAAIGASAALAALWPSAGFAAQDTFPTPGAANCHGQLLGFGASHGHPPGLVAKLKNESVQAIQAQVDAFCGG